MTVVNSDTVTYTNSHLFHDRVNSSLVQSLASNSVTIMKWWTQSVYGLCKSVHQNPSRFLWFDIFLTINDSIFINRRLDRFSALPKWVSRYQIYRTVVTSLTFGFTRGRENWLQEKLAASNISKKRPFAKFTKINRMLNLVTVDSSMFVSI